MEANELANCIPERGHHRIKTFYSSIFVIRCTTTISTVLVVTSTSGLRIIPVFDVRD